MDRKKLLKVIKTIDLHFKSHSKCVLYFCPPLGTVFSRGRDRDGDREAPTAAIPGLEK